MFTKTIAAMAVAVFVGTTVAAVAQGWQGDNGYGASCQDRYGLGYYARLPDGSFGCVPYYGYPRTNAGH